MADPLSIASGVAGLLSLGIQVTQNLINFYSAYKDQASDLIQITRNLESLLVIFDTLDKALKARQPQINEEELLKSINNAVLDCNEVIEELQVECRKFLEKSTSGFKGRIQVAGRQAAYPFRKSTLQKLEEDISEIRNNLSLALDVLQVNSNNMLQEEAVEIKSLLKHINAVHVSSRIRDWLAAPDVTSNHNNARDKHHAGTGSWFVNGPYFKNWLVERNSFLWVNGFAGCGKSIICSTAIESTFNETQRRPGVGVGFFYFSFNDESKIGSSGMLRALLLQLSAQLKNDEKNLQQLYEAYKSGTPPVGALLSSLKSIICKFQDSYILLDALDESPRDSGREDVLQTIKIMRDWNLPGFHLLATSRDELDIRQSLQTPRTTEVMMRNAETDKDITNFVSYRLSHDPGFQKWKVRHGEILENLNRKAQGVFRYVECQLMELKRVKNRNQLDNCLLSLPRDLDETYERILCSIDRLYAEDVRRILTILCLAKRPLTLAELIDAHAVDLEEPPHLNREGRSYDQDDIIDVYNEKQEAHVARIAHFSVQEYLESNRVLEQKAKKFAVQKGPANIEIAQICLVYLLEPGLSNDPLDEERLTEFPLAHFAAVHWYDYYQQAGGGSSIDRLVLRLFTDGERPFLTWVRLHDMDEPWGSGIAYGREVKRIPLPVYYSALLGLEAVLDDIIASWRVGSQRKDIINTKGGHYGNALQAASYRGHEGTVQRLLDQGAEVNAQGAEVNAQGGEYGNALQAASSGGHEKVVQILLDQVADVNAQGGLYGNALQAASYKGHEGVVQILLDQGAEVNAQGGEYGNALVAASAGGHKGVVQILLDQGAEVNAENRVHGNALVAASARGHEEVVQILLDQGAEVNAQANGHEKVVQILLDQGADAASAEGHERLAQILLRQGAEVNAQGGYYGNALAAASAEGNEGVVQILLKHGAEVDAQGGEYGNALQAASSGGHEKVVQRLLDQGAEVNAQGGEYGNALQAASAEGHERLVQILLGRGAEVNAQGGD
ncbi:ankyrin repeat-containing domain protein [Aspergillus similis]